MIPDDLTKYLTTIPDWTEIPTVDDLIDELETLGAANGDLCRWRRYGTSRLGDPLRVLSIGHGERNVLILGGPHANEPYGALTVSHLARLVIEHAELRDDLTWHFLPWANPDAARMNEGWFAGPRSIRDYHEHLHRPAPVDDVDFTFPNFSENGYYDRPLPETQAVMRILEDLRPVFQYSLHNCDFGGVFYVLDHDVPGLAEDLLAFTGQTAVPLAMDSAAVAGLDSPGKGVYLLPPAELIDGGIAEVGATSGHWAAQYGTTTLVTEIPMWNDPCAADDADSGRTVGEVFGQAATEMAEASDVLAGLMAAVRPALRCGSPLAASAESLVRLAPLLGQGMRAAAEAMDERPAAVGEAFVGAITPYMIRMRGLGQLRRLLRAELATGNQAPVLRATVREADALFDQACHAAGMVSEGNPFPLREVVAVQVGAGLVALRRILKEAR
ncbi:M14 family zinc carboxypeptidase [Nonomuraea sp. NPDC059023]|uniref:M14 family zinc carboxypeptidase n=1 Tax=unclassified Nonomuraea TaxID=2593643 RepID=UPI0036CEAB6C